ncbi:MAG TPA: OmpA family protein [Polyangiales bacterium]
MTVLALVIALSAVTTRAHAEPVLLSVEANGALAITAPQSERFGPGASVSAALLYPLGPALLFGVRLRAGLLANGPAPTDPRLADPGTGSFELATLSLRLRPFASGQGVRRATGLFLDAGGGGAITGGLKRGSFEAGLGYGIRWGSAAIAPTLRYVQVMQPADRLSSEDARLLMLGAELTFFDAQPTAALAKQDAAVPEPRDRDNDGIADAHDKCPDDPEDFDGYEDADGCPDPDNDKDGIKDKDDKCPNQAEDFDQFEDKDGCPDFDNDKDGFLDADDQCPNEAEIINGNKDFDGCPDEGLIEFKDDRIVLEERVLFDFERARVKREARPLLRAIVNLKSQHPDWIKVVIEGHADARGDAKFNQELSEHRARNVMKELVKLGISESQIEFVGYGATRLRDRRDDEEGHARNRRVEFVVTAHGIAPVTTAPSAAPAAPNGAQGDDEDSEPDEPVRAPTGSTDKPAASEAKSSTTAPPAKAGAPASHAPATGKEPKR